MFTIECQHIGSKTTLSWKKGKLEGDSHLSMKVKQMIKHTRSWDDPAYGTVKVTMKDPVAVFLIIKSLVSNVAIIEGSVPPCPSIPEGAVS